MKLNKKALANTLAIISFTAFLICMIWAGIDRSSFVAFWESWAHGFDLDLIISEDIGSVSAKALFGLISFTASSWVAGYSLAWLYNKLAKEK